MGAQLFGVAALSGYLYQRIDPRNCIVALLHECEAIGYLVLWGFVAVLGKEPIHTPSDCVSPIYLFSALLDKAGMEGFVG